EKRYEEALKLLLDCAEEGKDDGVWNFRVGYSLYYLEREEEAAVYFKKAIDYGDDGEDTQAMLRYSLEEAEQKKRAAGYHPELYTEAETGCLEEHVKNYFGNYDNVFHELESPDIHVDILRLDPVPGRNYFVLVTQGMGAHRMNVPPELENIRDRAELLICLPPGWDFDNLDDENNYWPIRWLKIMARLPGNEDTWLGWGHTVPCGGPFSDNTKLCAMMLLSPGAFDRRSGECRMPDGSIVNFYQMVPLYGEETDLKVQKGVNVVLDLLDRDCLEYVQIDRRNVCAAGTTRTVSSVNPEASGGPDGEDPQ
ncbi:MAG: suppressor of fused domain protein, partial [Treponema sp.]|nr:suppressor of fused domain protein [Treponema sp.]